jgi:alkaline phosphatase D
MTTPLSSRWSRRYFLQAAAASAVTLPQLTRTPAFSLDASRPQMPDGVMTGDLSRGQVALWSRCDRPAQMLVEYSLEDSFRQPMRLTGPQATQRTDFTAKLLLTGLPENQRIFYRVSFRSETGKLSAPQLGQFSTPGGDRDIRFVWSGDTAGQGWGINPEWGGMKIYETMRLRRPDFMIHSGDTIYADGPLKSSVLLEDGSTWRNIVTPEKSKVAETLAEFRGNYRYNLMDENVRRFNAEVPLLVQWDDHEVVNNWYPGEILDDARYSVKDVNLLTRRAKQAFLDYFPIAPMPSGDRLYRAFRHGPLLDIFMLDMRSDRGPNSPNRQAIASRETQFLGRSQIEWLRQQLIASQATWKVIAADMPLGLVVADGKTDFEGLANGDGPALGRELELAQLLRTIKQAGIKNVVWLTADVHYAAAHYYDPNQAIFQDFEGFWEFVAGPLHAGTFGPNPLDNTFGPQVKFQSIPANLKPNRPPTEGFQFFGEVSIAQASRVMTVKLVNLQGKTVFSIDLPPRESA